MQTLWLRHHRPLRPYSLPAKQALGWLLVSAKQPVVWQHKHAIARRDRLPMYSLSSHMGVGLEPDGGRSKPALLQLCQINVLEPIGQ